jgi:hypothetical protein
MLRAFRAVFWSFFGVRKGIEHDSDAKTLNVQHVIVAGLLSALAFVLLLVGVVYLVTR